MSRPAQSVGEIIRSTYEQMYREHPAYFRNLEDYFRPPIRPA